MRNKETYIVVIDGPAASGKSTTARLVAKKLGWLYLDTGAMYRAMAVKTVRNGIRLDDAEAIAHLAEHTQIRLEPNLDNIRVFVDGEEVTDAIRTPEIDKAVGPVCEVPKVREILVAQQRQIGSSTRLVAEGRDMGTIVFPNADLKVFMVASIKARAIRRQKDQEKRGIHLTLEEIEADIERRDARDSQRENSPLKQAEDAVILDTSELSIEEQVDWIIQRIKN